VHVVAAAGLHAPPAPQSQLAVVPVVQPQNGRHEFTPAVHPLGMQAVPAGHWQLFSHVGAPVQTPVCVWTQTDWPPPHGVAAGVVKQLQV